MERQQQLTRAGQLVAAGPYDARPAEVAALHAALFPARDPVCQTCPRELGVAYYAIKRWVEQQGAADDAPHSFPFMKKHTTARFKSDTTVYTPHGLGVAYSNANLTDKAARDIIAADPDAKEYFSTLPAEADEDEAPVADQGQGQQPTALAEQLAASAESRLVPATVPADFDYQKLATAMLDEVERRQAAKLDNAPASETRTDEVTLSAQPGGQGADGVTSATTPPATVAVTTTKTEHDDDEHDDDKPVRLSRMNKEQLQAAHLAEVGKEAPADATNDELREAIAAKRNALTE